MDINDEVQQQKFIKYAKWGIAVVAVAVIAPIAWLAVSGILGLTIAGAIGLIGINGAPVMALKLSNMKYRAMDAENVSHVAKIVDAASQNPIETLKLQLVAKRQASEQFAQAISSFSAEVKNFKDQVDGFKLQYPQDADRFDAQFVAMNQILSNRKDRYAQVKGELNNFDAAIKRAEAMWKMSLAAQKMNKLAGMEMGDPFEKIKSDSAIDSVLTNMNKAFAEMETDLMDNKELKEVKQAEALKITKSNIEVIPTIMMSNKVEV